MGVIETARDIARQYFDKLSLGLRIATAALFSTEAAYLVTQFQCSSFRQCHYPDCR
jgi:hypothetical protein